MSCSAVVAQEVCYSIIVLVMLAPLWIGAIETGLRLG